MNIRPVCTIPPLLFLTATATAANAQFTSTERDNAANHMHIQAGFAPLTENKLPEITATPHYIDNGHLLKNPELFHDFMRQALNSQNPELLQTLQTAYRDLPQADKQLVQRADATLARWRGDYRAAVKLHRALQLAFPLDSRIALDTAATFLEDRRWQEAESRFWAAQQTFRLPENVNRNVARHMRHIRWHNKWHIGGNIGLARHANVNHAPPEYCTPIACQKTPPVHATALNYRVDINKNTPLRGNHNVVFRANVAGTSHYLSRKSQYDHALGRVHLGWQFQNARDTVNVLPFYQAQWAGSDEFERKPVKDKTLSMSALAHATGLQITAARQHSARWGSSVSAEVYRQHYRDKARAQRDDGRHSNVAVAARWQATPQQAVWLHVGRQQFQPQQREWAGRVNNAAYTRHGVAVAWQAHWRKWGGWQTHFQAAFAQRQYRGVALNERFAWQKQRNRERTFSASVAHDRVQWAGVMPKLVATYSRTDSSHAWARRKQKQLFVEMVKQF